MAKNATSQNKINPSAVMETTSETDTLPSVSVSPHWFTITRKRATVQKTYTISNTLSTFSSLERRLKWSIISFFIFVYFYFRAAISL